MALRDTDPRAPTSSGKTKDSESGQAYVDTLSQKGAIALAKRLQAF